jgi:maleylacetate reductase
MRFVHQSTAARVVFGAGTAASAADEAQGLGRRLLLIVDAVAAATAPAIRDALAAAAVEVIDRVRQHVPVEDAEAARRKARAARVDAVVAFGGGSAVGLAKAVALTERVPILAVPTTYAGSEMTPVWGLTADGVKTTGRDPAVAPAVVIYDPRLTLSLPPGITAASGLNALAHCVDALWAAGRTPLTDAMAERGIAELAAGLPAAVRDPGDLAAREHCLTGAWLAGATFAVAGSSLHHKLCHLLGGAYDLPHAETHAVLLPWVVAALGDCCPGAAAAIARALDDDDAAGGVWALAEELGVPASLGELGLSEQQALQLADRVALEQLSAPIALTRADLRALLGSATRGRARVA